ncbi:MAG: arginine--tRNA ligase [Erysipelotrichaceae bacterium]|nr:arginine--tRNA ligase [Erysipelotrichaceae bacterium]
MMVEEKLITTLKRIVTDKYGIDPDDRMVMIEIPKDNANGDYSTNLAMRLTKLLRRRPQEIAAEIKEEILSRLSEVENIEIAGPGFINFWIRKDAIANVINNVIAQGDNYGHSNTGKGVKYLEEYVSANPTGPLHCGHARGAVWGDSCVRILKAAGYDATREYYINDAGAQIHNLGLSLYARIREHFGLNFTLPEDGYHGPDVIEIAKEIIDDSNDYYLTIPEEEAVEKLAEIGRNMELERIKKDLRYYGCEFDSWISEKWIVGQGMVDAVVAEMTAKGLTYEQDDALWFKATEYGDEKDRVLRKSNGLYTYLTPDIANHKYKYDRGYEVLVNIWGADHHGYIPRMKAAMKALGYNSDNLLIDLCQMVRMVENGVEVKMSKRTGNAITLRELIDDIGLDAARYFFLSKALDSHLEFDLGLARSQTNDNPVYYAQYAYARICSVLRQAETKPQPKDSFSLLTTAKEIDLLKHVSSFPDVVADAAISRAPNLICNYVQKLASYFHSFYGSCKVNDKDNPELSAERLALLEATRITLKNALYLLGVNAPEKMVKSETELDNTN